MATPSPARQVPLNLTVSRETSEEIARRAAARGTDAAHYAAEILEHAVSAAAPLDEVLAPVHQAFEASGMTEDELSDLLEAAKHRRRAERRMAGGDQ